MSAREDDTLLLLLSAVLTRLTDWGAPGVHGGVPIAVPPAPEDDDGEETCSSRLRDCERAVTIPLTLFFRAETRTLFCADEARDLRFLGVESASASSRRCRIDRLMQSFTATFCYEQYIEIIDESQASLLKLRSPIEKRTWMRRYICSSFHLALLNSSLARVLRCS